MVVYRGVSWPRARCEPAARAGRLSCLAGGLPKGNCVPFFGESGRFRGKAGREGGFLLEVFFLSFFLFSLSLSFFGSTRMKDVREYITRVKLVSLFDAFVKFVHFFMEFDAQRILFSFDVIEVYHLAKIY